MSGEDFQHEMLKRLGRIEADVKGLKVELNGWRERLGERCEARREIGEDTRRESAEIKRRVENLEALEHKRRGGMIVVSALLAAAGAIGGLVAKCLENIR